MDFGIAISGLNASSTSIDTIGNNISNASTVGFKTAVTEFAAQYLPPIGGGSAQSGGAGVKVQQVAQQFTQGSITNTGNSLDVAIDGNGFLQLNNNGATQYTRNGQLQVDAQGYLVSSNGARVQGYAANGSGGVIAGTVTDLKIPTVESAPTVTSVVKGNLNLDSRSTVPTTTVFSPSDQTSFNNESSVVVYDSLGNPHTLSNYFKLSATPAAGGPSIWDVYSYLDGKSATSSAGVPSVTPQSSNTGITSTTDVTTTAGSGTTAYDAINLLYSDANGWTGTDATQTGAAVTVTSTTNADGSTTLALSTLLNGVTETGPTVTLSASDIPSAGDRLSVQQAPATLTFNASGALVGANGSTSSNIVSLAAPLTNGSTTPLAINYDFTGTTQYGSSFAVTALSQNGGGPGILTGFSFSPDGTITGTYSNGKTGALGQVTLTNFVNPQGLQRNGDNTWVATALSGTPIAAAPAGSNGTGSLQGSSLESSNVDLTKELVNLITAQRDYQASAQTVKTLDAMFNTIDTLR